MVASQALAAAAGGGDAEQLKALLREQRDLQAEGQATRLEQAHVIAALRAALGRAEREQAAARPPRVRNTKGYSSTYLAMGFANVRAGTF